MAFRLCCDETLPDGLRRIADEQMCKAVKLMRASEDDLEEAVHNARKCFKKIRALLRLIRTEIGRDTYKRENIRFRDAARKLSAARDSVVRIRTLDKLREYSDTHPDRFDRVDIDFAPIRAFFAGQYDIQSQMLGIDGKLIGQVIKTTKQSRKGIADWHFRRDDIRAIREGLLRTYTQGRRSLKLAYVEPTIENFHEFRKQVKDYWYYARILQPADTKYYGRLASRLKILSEFLGDEHDLAMLRESIVSPSVRESVGKLKRLRSMIDQRRVILREEIRPLARRIYREKPKYFIARIEEHWSSWQD